MSTIRIDSTAFEYKECGEGESLILVHGSASDYRTWDGQFDEFSEHFRTTLYSRRYHWPNKKIPAGADYAMSQQVNDLAKLIQSFDAVPAHLVGHSYGAFLCLLVAIKHPDLVRSMVLAEPPVLTLFVSNTPKPTELLKLMVTRPLTALAIIKLGITGLAPAKKAARNGEMEKAMRLFGRSVLGPKFYKNLSESRHEQIRANAIKAELLGSGFVSLQPNDLRQLACPTLFINGAQSPNVFHYFIDRLCELLPHAKRRQIPHASHNMHEDNSGAFNQEVLSFLKQEQQAE